MSNESPTWEAIKEWRDELRNERRWKRRFAAIAAAEGLLLLFLLNQLSR